MSKSKNHLKEVRVMGRKYKITEPSLINDGMQTLGLAHFDAACINIRDDHGTESAYANTLLHETLHIIDNAAGLDLSEKQVTVLANCIMGVLSDNPEFVQCILGGLE